MWFRQFRSIQMLINLNQVDELNNYQTILNDGEMFNNFNRFGVPFIYFIFGMLVRPIFMDFIGPFLPFLSVFQVVRNEGDSECANVKDQQLSLINYLALALFSASQLFGIMNIMAKYKKEFREQVYIFDQKCRLKAEVAQNEY